MNLLCSNCWMPPLCLCAGLLLSKIIANHLYLILFVIPTFWLLYTYTCSHTHPKMPFAFIRQWKDWMTMDWKPSRSRGVHWGNMHYGGSLCTENARRSAGTASLSWNTWQMEKDPVHPFKFWPHFISMCCHASLPAAPIHYQPLWHACGIITLCNPLFHIHITDWKGLLHGNENMEMFLRYSFINEKDQNVRFCLFITG